MKKGFYFVVLSLVGYFGIFYLIRTMLSGLPFFTGDLSDEIYIHVALVIGYIAICTNIIVNEIRTNNQNDE